MTGHMTLVAQQGADSITLIDSEIQAVRAISVDTSVLPKLGQDVQALQGELSSWDVGLRAQVTSTLSGLLTDDTGAASKWAAVDKTDAQAMLGFAENVRGGLTKDDTAIEALSTALADFRQKANASVASLKTDMQALNQQINNEQALAANLYQKVKAQQDRIKDYEAHPWKLITDGLSISGLERELSDLQDALNGTSSAMSELRRVEQRMNEMQRAQGPLLCLTTALTVLGGSITNVKTAMDQISAKLTALMAEKPVAPIINAELEAVFMDMNGADKIAKEVLA